MKVVQKTVCTAVIKSLANMRGFGDVKVFLGNSEGVLCMCVKLIHDIQLLLPHILSLPGPNCSITSLLYLYYKTEGVHLGLSY